MANKIYGQVETAISWQVSGGDEVMDLGNTTGAADGVEVGAYHDWGAAPRSFDYMWFMDIDGFDTAPVVGETVDLYVTVSEDATLWSGPESPSDAARGAGVVNRLPNLLYVGSAMVRSVTAGDNLVASGRVHIPQRYFAPVVHNNTADKLLSTADAHEVRFYPIPLEVQ
jgi:hypothetical protein